MFVAVILTLCFVATGDCQTEYATDSDQSPGLTFMGCMIGQAQVADWKAKSEYASDKWRVARIRCIPDRGYVVKQGI